MSAIQFEDITFNHNRDEAIAVLAKAYENRFIFLPSELNQKLSGWVIIGLVVASELIGAVCIRANEGHIAILKKFRGKWNSSKTLIKLCKYFGVTKTVVMADNIRCMDWLEHCGFVRCGQVANGVLYAIK